MTNEGKELYTLEPVDRCLHREGLQCGYPEAEHPLNLGGFTHEFKPGAKDFFPVAPGSEEALARSLHATANDGTYWDRLHEHNREAWRERARVLIRDHGVQVEVGE